VACVTGLAYAELCVCQFGLSSPDFEENAMARTWEYKLLVGHGLTNTLQDHEGTDLGILSVELLNKLDKDGWEVCSHTIVPLTMILKRKVSTHS
jgi:hypothetical protein